MKFSTYKTVTVIDCPDSIDESEAKALLNRIDEVSCANIIGNFVRSGIVTINSGYDIWNLIRLREDILSRKVLEPNI